MSSENGLGPSGSGRLDQLALRLMLLLAMLVLDACWAPRIPGRAPTDGVASEDPSGEVTPSMAPGPVRFAVKGDWGAGTEAQARVTRRMCALRAETPFRDVVTTGDNFYDPDGRATQRNYHEPEACLISHSDHSWRAVWGNHDGGGPSTADVLATPDRYYSWSSGQVQFFMLDSNRPADGAQNRWLAEGLAASTASVTVAVFHHPPFTTGAVHAPDAGVRRHWVPLFQRHGVDLVLSGHQHLYEHLSLVGVEYVVTGGGGRSLYPCGTPRSWLVRCLSEYHFLLVEVEGRVVTVTAVNPSGEILDRFVMDP